MKRFIVGVFLALSAIAVFADPKADEIVKAMLDQKSPSDMTSISTMAITDRTGVVKTRKMKQVSKETPEGTKSFVEFVEPADVNGTKFLTVSKKGADSDQRMYLPALKKIRKISSSSKDGDFLGSDINYFDMEKRYFEDGSYTLLSEGETLDGPGLEGKKFAKIQTVFKDPNCPYSKTISWIDSASKVAYRTECYDKKDGALLKTITIDEIQTIKGYTFMTKSTFVNNKKGSKTVTSLENITPDTGVKDSAVSVKRLEQS
jgi:hypothetical protein